MKTESKATPRIGLFRRIAVLCYRGALEADHPWLLEARRPALPLIALILLGVLVWAWLG